VCARFHQHKPRALIRVLTTVFQNIDVDQVDDAPLYNIAPTDTAWVLRLDRLGDPEPVPLRWGLLPHWAKEPRIGVRAINARARTIGQKPTFREPFQQRRCLIPVNGFYEWAKGEDGTKLPHNITGEHGEPLVFAGLWARNRRIADEPIDTFTIITTPPNPLLARIHDRMPAVLAQDAWRAWLDPQGQPEALGELLRPFDGPMSAYPVDRRVGNVRLKDDPTVIEPIGPALVA
jgi:putative SOS response-associated peptidase YedK